MTLHKHLLAASALTLGSSALHAVNTYSATWDGTASQSWSGGDWDGYYYSTMYMASSGPWGLGGMQLPALSVNFTSDKTFNITFSAPVGQKITITPPPTPLGTIGTPSTRLEFYVGTNTGFYGEMFNGPTPTFTFQGLQGTATGNTEFSYATYASSSYYPQFPGEFYANALIDFVGTISFTSVSIDFTVPESMTIAGNYTDPAAYFTAFWRGDFDPEAGYGAAPSQPGNWVSLTPVPEASTYGLMLGGLALVAVALRRRNQPKA